MNRWTPVFLASLLIVVAGVIPALAATNAQEVDEASSLQSDLVTPHKPWGQGHVGGRVKTLFFIYTGAYAGEWEDPRSSVREVVELNQRFDLDAEALLFCGKAGSEWVFHGQKLGEQRAERLLKKNYDLYVLAGFAMSNLPAKIQYLILKEVADGAGLLCCGPGAGEYMVDRRKIAPTPGFLTGGVPQLREAPVADVVSAYQLGEGRGAWLRYGTRSLVPNNTFSPSEQAAYDYHMMLVGRAALWAAGREGDLSIDAVMGDQPPTLDRTAQGNSGEIAISSTLDRAIEGTAQLELRRAADGVKYAIDAQPVALAALGQANLTVPIPQVPAGDYFLDVIVRSKRGIETFGAGALTVASDFGVEAVSVDSSFVEVGESISGPSHPPARLI